MIVFLCHCVASQDEYYLFVLISVVSNTFYVLCYHPGPMLPVSSTANWDKYIQYARVPSGTSFSRMPNTANRHKYCLCVY